MKIKVVKYFHDSYNGLAAEKTGGTKKEELFTSSSMTAKKLFCNVFANDCHNGIKSSAISVDV